MNVVFRTDAAITIGTGHLMRCLTLADELRRKGAHCHFICREEVGHALNLIRLRGHAAHAIPVVAGSSNDVAVDALRTRAIMANLHFEWLIVDHYRLGEEWECQMRSAASRLCVIDDIGRAHKCDMLLDQNYANPTHSLYRQSLAAETELLLGPEFALLRPEFSALRAQALRRRNGALRRFLVTMGGTDPSNETGKSLAGLLEVWKPGWSVDVVIGSGNPHHNAVADACKRFPDARLHVQTGKMAELMLAADCAITAGGSTTWERCCLGLPSLVTVLSSDQLIIAQSVAKAGAQVFLGWDSSLTAPNYAQAVADLSAEKLSAMSIAAAAICDGNGVQRVAARLN